MNDYEHLLPFLTSHTLRFSYGQVRGAPALAWGRHVGRLPAVEMVAALEQAGFSALWLDPRGYPDGGEKLLTDLATTGRRGLEAPGAREQRPHLPPASRRPAGAAGLQRPAAQ